MWVVDTAQLVLSVVDTCFEMGYYVLISWDAEDAFRLCAAECQDAIGEEGENDGNAQLWVGAFLSLHDGFEGLAEHRGVEGSILMSAEAIRQYSQKHAQSLQSSEHGLDRPSASMYQAV